MNRFFISFRYTLLMMEIKPEVKNRIMTHNKSVVGAKFNSINNQVRYFSLDFIFLFLNICYFILFFLFFFSGYYCFTRWYYAHVAH